MRKIFLLALVGVSATLVISQGIAVTSYVVKTEQNRLLTAYERDAFVLSGRVENILENPDLTDATLAPLVDDYAKNENTQVIVVNSSGIVVLTSNPAELPLKSDFTSRPEIVSALGGNIATGERYSNTLKSNLVYVAVPVINGSKVYGAVRLSFPHGEIDQAVMEQTRFLWVIAGLGVGLSILLSFLISGLITRPLRRIEQQTIALASGDFATRLPENKGPAEIRSLAKNFNSMAEKLDSLIRQQNSFASDASHQLRTPLTALLIRIERARASLAKDKQATETELADAANEVARLTSIVEGLLAIARSEAASSEKVVVDIAKIAAERIEAWQALGEERGVTVAFEGPNSLQCVAIPNAVEQVIDNYIDNAISHSPANSAVLVRIIDTQETALLQVIDSGPGLSKEQCERAFDRFWRADSTKEGSGLGLAIVRQLTEMCGGNVKLAPRAEGQTGIIAVAEFRKPAKPIT